MISWSLVRPAEFRGLSSNGVSIFDAIRCTVGACCPGAGCVLGTLGRLMLEFGRSLCDIAGYRHVDGSSCVIPFETEIEVAGAQPRW
jgi:hypothetical protein